MIGFIYHDLFARHLEGYNHVESPLRYTSILKRIRNCSFIDSIMFTEAVPARREWLESVHDGGYVEGILSLEVKDAVILDWGDTVATPRSVEAAVMSAGAGVQGARMVLERKCSSVFSAGRPPGHHAEKDRAMGFCIFNNIAITAAWLLDEGGLDRVAIVDWDIHHGNGTESIFFEDNRVLYISLHQYPHYPGTGHSKSVGTGAGKGYNINIPVGAGAGEDLYIEEFQGHVLPALDSFRPQFILISAGFDGHEADPLAGGRLTSHSYAAMTSLLLENAKEQCGGRIVSLLEGGYNLEALSESVEAHLAVLAGRYD